MHSCPGLKTCPMLLILLVYDFRALIRHTPYATSTSPIMHLISSLPQILHNLCFSFLLGFTAVPREIENKGCAKFWGVKKWIMGDVQVAYEPFQINKTF